MSLALDPVESSGALVGHVDGLRGRLRPWTPLAARIGSVSSPTAHTRQRRAIIPLTINDEKETDDVHQ